MASPQQKTPEELVDEFLKKTLEKASKRDIQPPTKPVPEKVAK